MVSQGFVKEKKNFKLLQKFNGDKDQVLAKLQAKKCGKGGKKAEKQQKILAEIEKAGFATQNQQLVSMGYDKVKKNFKLLSKTGGNVDATVEMLLKSHKKGHQEANAEMEEKLKQL